MSAAYVPTSKASAQSPVDSHISSLLTTQQFKLAIAKERFRCDRHGVEFGLIITQLYCPKSEFKKRLKRFSRILDRRLRLTDEKGFLEGNLVAILLPMTNFVGTRKVLSDVTTLAADEGIFFRAKLVVYPPVGKLPTDLVNEKDENDKDDSDRFDSADSVNLVDNILSGTYQPDFPSIPVSCQSISIGNAYDFVAKPYPLWKRSFDVVASSMGLLVAAPIIAAAAVAIKATSEGPVFFKQARTGQHNKQFHILKLRTMVKNAEELKASLQERNERDGPAFKMKSDPRVTPVAPCCGELV